MQAGDPARAQAAAISIASALGLTTDDAIALHNSNKLTLRLLPCDVLARVAPAAEQVALFEVQLAQRLAEAGCPVAALEPGVAPDAYERDGFVVTLWTHYPPTEREIPPADYATALAGLHTGMRDGRVATPHFTDRVDSPCGCGEPGPHTGVRRRGPGAAPGTLRRLGASSPSTATSSCCTASRTRATCSSTERGLLFVDLETCCRGPGEFDLAHAPDEVGEHYPGVDRDLLHQCRILVLAMITAWRWDRGTSSPTVFGWPRSGSARSGRRSTRGNG